jgi:hypothetical protein
MPQSYAEVRLRPLRSRIHGRAGKVESLSQCAVLANKAVLILAAFVSRMRKFSLTMNRTVSVAFEWSL